jgi:16S rRNA (uracil1498-N3)-methyltransferase
MADRFYTNSPLAPGPALLQGPEAHHLATVLRAKPGERITLFNGDGCEYPAEVVAVNRKSVTVRVMSIERPARELPIRLQVAAPLPKGDRGDFLIEKLTELGATDFTPLRTERSVVHPREAKLDRLERTVIEASKQCGRNFLLRIHGLTSWPEFARRDNLPRLRVLAHLEESGDLPPELGKTNACVAVGPEGGFTGEEVELARQAGWQIVGLGPRILRVETAALMLACRAASRS